MCACCRLQVVQSTSALLALCCPSGSQGGLKKKKSCLVSSQSTFLSVTLDSVTMKACPSLWRVNDILPFFQQNRSLCAVPAPPRKVDICRNCCALGLAVTMPPPTGAEQHRIRMSQRCLLALSPWKKGPSCYRACLWVLLHSGRQSPWMLPSQGEVQYGRTEQLRGSVLSRSRWSMSVC